MLSEINGVRQIAGEGIRRWFRDDEFDLIIWYRDDGAVDGLQLCYNKSTSERALTWHSPDRYEHHAIDDGENGNMGPKMTPVLLADGHFSAASVNRMFQTRSGEIPKDITDLVSKIISGYTGI